MARQSGDARRAGRGRGALRALRPQARTAESAVRPHGSERRSDRRRPRRSFATTFRERLVHAAAALSYVYLLLTGLAFWTPALYWLAIVLGGGYLSRLLHPWVGLVFTAAVVVMYVTWRRDMRTTPEDVDWRKAIGHYIRNEDAQVPPAGRFNFGQKQLFWLMVLGGLALLVSGLVLWFWRPFPGRCAAALRRGARPRVAALVTIAGFIVHLYMGLAVVPGGLSAILHGESRRVGAPPSSAVGGGPYGERPRSEDIVGRAGPKTRRYWRRALHRIADLEIRARHDIADSRLVVDFDHSEDADVELMRRMTLPGRRILDLL